ncbi:MAG TPA: hypothetical protein VM123_13290 [archaeon]|nr:hypothetical protein [archaeon]
MYPYRWVYLSTSLEKDSELERVRAIAKTASEHGLNGIMMFGDFDLLSLKPPDYFRRLKEMKSFCDDYGLEIIPRCLDMGYNDETALHHDKNLAEGLPVKDALFVARGGEAQLVPDPQVGIANGSFEEHQGDRAAGFSITAKPGEEVFVDTEDAKEGDTALRFENFGSYADNALLLSQEVTVSPYRCYRLSCWMKNQGANPPEEGFPLRILGADGRRLEYFAPQAPPDSQWHKAVYGFNSLGYDKVVIGIGAMGAKEGKFLVDDLRLEEAGLVNVLRRPGTPVSVRSEKTGTLYEEGRDYASVADTVLDFRFDHYGPAIRLLTGSRIAESERLRVSWYHGMTVYFHQVVACMSEPEIYDIWRTQARLIQEHLAPGKYFLSVDELRAGGTCKACRDRGLTMGQMVGDCVTRQVEIIREVNPEAEIFIWSDMFDPFHNAGERPGNYYYHVDGVFTGSWNYIPKDLVIACWYHRMRYESLGHFSSLGFRTMACGYYDADNLDNDKTWLEALDVTPGAVGIMYTTWSNKYALLGDFGDLVSRR